MHPNDIEFALRYEGPQASHTDRLFVAAVDMQRSRLPRELGTLLAEAQPGKRVHLECGPGELVPRWDDALRLSVREDQLPKAAGNLPIEPRVGRFFPRGLLRGVPGVLPKDRRPMRVVGRGPGTVELDFNHPLARCALSLYATAHAPAPTASGEGGTPPDVAALLVQGGPGMQMALPGRDTDFGDVDALRREDEADDPHFYAEPRLVHHLDAAARGEISGIYRRLLDPNSAVLDLMSSWVSHLPDEVADLRVTGLGLNAAELEQNTRLAQRVVQDLNRDPPLPFPDAVFDAAVCAASIEYLLRPLEVLRETARVLKPGAPFVATFSERWFPPKTIRIWPRLHPFERMGFVLDLFRRSGCFVALATESIRGLPRPADDRYAGTLAHADPVYAVWGRRASSLPGAVP